MISAAALLSDRLHPDEEQLRSAEQNLLVVAILVFRAGK